jgi:zinc protease
MGLMGSLISGPVAFAGAYKVQEVKEGSLSAWILEDEKSPLISLVYSFRLGSAFDPKGKEGLATLYSHLFFKNRKNWKGADFMKELEDLGASAHVSCSKDYIYFTWEFPGENGESVLKLIQKSLQDSSFDQETFERYRDQLPGDVLVTYTDANVLGRKALESLLFPGHPYGRSLNGTPEGVQAISLKDLEEFSKGRLARDQLKVAMAGAVTPSLCQHILSTCFKGLAETSSASQPLPPVPLSPDPKGVAFIEKHTSQSTLFFGQTTLGPFHADWYSMVILNHVVGGGDFTSRLWMKLREEMGITYSVSTSLINYLKADFLGGSLRTDKATAATALKKIMEIWTQVHEAGITARELDEAKSYLTAEVATAMTNSTDIANILLRFQHFGYPVDYLEKRSQLIQKVTLEDVNRVAKEILNPDKLFMVVVGEAN